MSRLLFLIMQDNITIQERQEAFLKVYPTAGTISAAANAIGIKRDRVNKWIKRDPEFAKRFEEARKGFVEALEDIALGLVKEMAEKRDYKANPTLLIFLLNGNAPEKYKGATETSGEARDLLAEFRKVSSDIKSESKKAEVVKNTSAQKTVLEYEEEKKALSEKFGSLKNGNSDGN